MGKPKGDSQERSFLKGVVSKRLEEIASNTALVDPLELLGVGIPIPKTPAPIPSVPATAPIVQDRLSEVPLSSPPPKQEYVQEYVREVIQEALESTPELQRVTTSAIVAPVDSEPAASQSHSECHHAHSHTLSITQSAAQSVTDAQSDTQSVDLLHSETHSECHSECHSVRDMPLSTQVTQKDVVTTLAVGKGGPVTLRPPRHWVRLAQALHRYRDPQCPSQTIPTSYSQLRMDIGRSYAAVRQALSDMISAGFISRKTLLQYRNGGSVYEFLPSFSALLIPLASEGDGPDQSRHSECHSVRDSGRSPSSSSISQKHQQLLQDWSVDSVDTVIWPEMFESVERSSVRPYAAVMPSAEYFQDFLDKVAAVVDYKKTTQAPITDPIGFLFGCLKKGQVNPPPGWKSRRVRMVEEEERRLRQEAEELRAAHTRMEQQRCEVFFLRLSDAERHAIEQEAAEGIAPTEMPAIQRAKREQRRLEIIRERMKKHLSVRDQA